MGSTRYTKHAGAVYTLHYHFVWCPKYRRKVLHGAIAERLKELLHESADALDVTVEGLEVLPDHVTVLAQVGERAQDIDVQRAERAKQRAEALLASPTSSVDLDIERARIALMKSLIRLQVATRARTRV